MNEFERNYCEKYEEYFKNRNLTNSSETKSAKCLHTSKKPPESFKRLKSLESFLERSFKLCLNAKHLNYLILTLIATSIFLIYLICQYIYTILVWICFLVVAIVVSGCFNVKIPVVDYFIKKLC